MANAAVVADGVQQEEPAGVEQLFSPERIAQMEYFLKETVPTWGDLGKITVPRPKAVV